MADEERTYKLELSWDEVGVIVEALRIQRERWEKALMQKLANDPEVSNIPIDHIQDGLARHTELLDRLPSHGWQ
jgi:hypothetical protein